MAKNFDVNDATILALCNMLEENKDTNTYKVEYNDGAVQRSRRPNKSKTIKGTDNDLMEFLDEIYVDCTIDDETDELKTLNDWLNEYEECYDPSGSTVVLKITKNGEDIYINEDYDYFMNESKKQEGWLEKEQPKNWCGIEGIKHIWNGSWSDPQIEYNGNIYNEWDVQEYVGDIFNNELEEQGKEIPQGDKWIDAFSKWCKENSDWVKAMIEELTPDNKVQENKNLKTEAKSLKEFTNAFNFDAFANYIEKEIAKIYPSAQFKRNYSNGHHIDVYLGNNDTCRFIIEAFINTNDDGSLDDGAIYVTYPSPIHYKGEDINTICDKWTGNSNSADFSIDEIDKALEMIKFVCDKFQKRDLDESKQLNEERYYYGEVEDIRTNIKQVIKIFDDITDQSNKCLNQSEFHEYSDLQKATLDSLKDNLKKSESILLSSYDALCNNFPTRIGTLTPEQKAYIEKHRDEIPMEESKEIKTETVEYISKEEFDNIPEEYKTTIKDTIDTEVNYWGKDREEVTKMYTDLGYDEEDPMILARDEKLGTVLKPVKITENKKLTENEMTDLAQDLPDEREPNDDTIDENVNAVVDGILVVVDPEINEDDYQEVIDRAQEIIEDTPEGKIPFIEDYLNQYIQTCPICGKTFVSKQLLQSGDTCPLCLEQPEQFITVGKIEPDEEQKEEMEQAGEEDLSNDIDIEQANTEANEEAIEEFSIEEQE